ncbi:hypothetical protein F5051DRAFT_423744 [Lentinula edodes]|nr:hypothetical protein F5051DRAFT_423744 [Lentinula edodes]
MAYYFHHALPPYAQGYHQPQPWLHQGNPQTSFENEATIQGGGTGVPSIPQAAPIDHNQRSDTDSNQRLERRMDELQERNRHLEGEIARIQAAQHRPPAPPPPPLPYRYKPYENEQMERHYAPQKRRRNWSPQWQDNSYHQAPPHWESRRQRGPPSSTTRKPGQGQNQDMRNTNRSIDSSVHAVPPRKITPSTVPPIPIAKSAHTPTESDSSFENAVFASKDEAWASASLICFEVTDRTPPDFLWEVNTGALVVMGETRQRIIEHGGPIVLPPPAHLNENISEESAVDIAERIIDEAKVPGNFTGFWAVWEVNRTAERKAAQEQLLGLTPEQTTISARLVANQQLFKSEYVDWYWKATFSLHGEPYDTSEDERRVPCPRMGTPGINSSPEQWALWIIVNADSTERCTGVAWSRAGYVDLATVRSYLLLRRLIRGIFGGQELYTERARIRKKNFSTHFLDLAAIPMFYGQKLTELKIVAEGSLDFKSSESTFETINDVTQHLASCGINADDMAEAFYFGMQAIEDHIADCTPGTAEWMRYKNLYKRAIARLQFCRIPIIANREWKLPDDWDMRDILEKRYLRVVQEAYERRTNSWRFAQGNPVPEVTTGPSMVELARSVGGMSI